MHAVLALLLGLTKSPKHKCVLCVWRGVNLHVRSFSKPQVCTFNFSLGCWGLDLCGGLPTAHLRPFRTTINQFNPSSFNSLTNAVTLF